MTCGYCDIIEGKRKSAQIYQDQKVIAFLSENPASIGHIVVVPKKHAPIFEAISDDDVDDIFRTVNKISISLFEAIKSEGTNIIIHNGIEAGQEEPHFSINIVTRKTGDGMFFEWAPKQLSEQEMSTVELQLKEELNKAEQGSETKTEAPKEEPRRESQKPGEKKNSKEPMFEIKSPEEEEENYLTKQLRRMP